MNSSTEVPSSWKLLQKRKNKSLFNWRMSSLEKENSSWKTRRCSKWAKLNLQRVCKFNLSKTTLSQETFCKCLRAASLKTIRWRAICKRANPFTTFLTRMNQLRATTRPQPFLKLDLKMQCLKCAKTNSCQTLLSKPAGWAQELLMDQGRRYRERWTATVNFLRARI